MPPVGSRLLAAQVKAARRRGVDVLPLMPYAERPPSPEAVEAVVREIRLNREAPSRGLPELSRVVAERVGAEIGQPVDPESDVLITNGSMQALNLVFRAILDPGDEVIIPAPCYFFGGCVEMAGGRPVHVPMDEAAGYAWDIDRIAGAVTPRTVAIVVNTPVNPTGVVLGEDTLRAIADLAERHDLLIVSDESYDTMVYDGRRHVSCASIGNAASRTALIRSFTKSYAMPAWRVGYIVGPPSVVDACTKAMEWEQLHGSHVAQAGAAAAMRNPVYPGRQHVPRIPATARCHSPVRGARPSAARRETGRGTVRLHQRVRGVRLLDAGVGRPAGGRHPDNGGAFLPVRPTRAHGLRRVAGRPARSRPPHCRDWRGRHQRSTEIERSRHRIGGP